MREYIRNITKTNDLILNGTLGNDEIDRFSKSDYRWADNKRKQDTICDLAWYLYNCNVNTEDDLAEWILDDRNAESLLEINGVGRKTIDYMKLLSGQQAIPIDRHMFQFLEIAGVLTADYKEASKILRKTASVLEVGESVLDKTIWKYMSEKKSDGQMSIFDICGEAIL